MAKTIVPTGTTAVFGTSGFSMNVDSIEWSGATREAINTSHMGTSSSHTFVPADLVDQGEITLNVHYDPDVTPPQNGDAETLTITWPLQTGDATSAKWSASVFLVDFGFSAAKEDKATASVKVKVTGNVTITAAT